MANEDKGDEKGKLLKTALDPTAKEFAEASEGAGQAAGETALVLAKTVRTLVAPLRALVWGADKIEEMFVPEVTEKLENVPPDQLISPNVAIAGPAIEALRFTGDQPELREMFANVLASSMNSATAKNVHPAFVEIIRQMTPDEARILKYMSENNAIPMIDLHEVKTGETHYVVISNNITHLAKMAKCEHLSLVRSYVDNLIRLEICYSPDGPYLADETLYDSLKNDPALKEFIQRAEAKSDVKIDIKLRFLDTTSFGKQFINACVRGTGDVEKEELL